MIEFKTQLKSYFESYSVPAISRFLILCHYPLFKLHWLAEYGKGAVMRIAPKVLILFSHYRLSHTVKLKRGDGSTQAVRIGIPFGHDDFSSFVEVIWAQGYKEVLALGPFHTMIDLGGNTGMAALFFILRGGTTRVLLVEANPDLVPVIRKSLDGVIGYVDVIVENACIGSKDEGFARFLVDKNHRHSHAATIVTGNTNTVRQIDVPCRALQSILEKHLITHVDLIKIDIEGGEHELIDIPNPFGGARVVVAEVHGGAQTRAQFNKKFTALGYRVLNQTVSSDDHSAIILGALHC